jgi:hypothetical protein
MMIHDDIPVQNTGLTASGFKISLPASFLYPGRCRWQGVYGGTQRIWGETRKKKWYGDF